MGHCVEYLVEAPSERVRAIVEAVTPYDEWVRFDDGAPPAFEAAGLLPSEVGGVVAPHATLFSVQVKWSWLIGDDSASIQVVSECDAWMQTQFPGCAILRIDEFVRVRCESEARREWWQMARPVHEVLARLVDDDRQHFRLIRSPNEVR